MLRTPVTSVGRLFLVLIFARQVSFIKVPIANLPFSNFQSVHLVPTSNP